MKYNTSYLCKKNAQNSMMKQLLYPVDFISKVYMKRGLWEVVCYFLASKKTLSQQTNECLGVIFRTCQ